MDKKATSVFKMLPLHCVKQRKCKGQYLHLVAVTDLFLHAKFSFMNTQWR